MDKTVTALVKELQGLSKEVSSDKDLQNVAAVSAGGNEDIGQLIADAMAKVRINWIERRGWECRACEGERRGVRK